MNKRKICVFSGKRGGFGAYLPLMQLIRKDSGLELQIVLGDMHTSRIFGLTVREARQYFPDSAIELIRMGTGRADTPAARTKSLGRCLLRAPDILEKLRPDIVMVHADRGEHLMMAEAALNFNIAVTHTQGGETSGNIDDIQRHAITKLSHIHFVETAKAAEKIKALGEEEWRINTVGSLYVDRIIQGQYSDPQKVRKKYRLADVDYVIILCHPDTYQTSLMNYRMTENVLSATQTLIAANNWKALVLYPCSDPGYEAVLRAIEDSGIEKDARFLIRRNVDNLDFLGLLKDARVLVGNSSCALVEAPYLKVPSVNVGDRQRGRDREENVIDCGMNFTEINAAIHKALSPSFAVFISNCGYRLGFGQASEKILKVLKNIEITERLIRKS